MIPWTNDFDELHRLNIPIPQIYENTPFYESFNSSDLCKNCSNGIRLLWCLIKTNIVILINLVFVMVYQNKFKKTIQQWNQFISRINKFNNQLPWDSAQITLSENEDHYANFLPTGAEKEIRNRLFPYRKIYGRYDYIKTVNVSMFQCNINI